MITNLCLSSCHDTQNPPGFRTNPREGSAGRGVDPARLRRGLRFRRLIQARGGLG